MNETTIRAGEIRILVTDYEGNKFYRDWKSSANHLDAIRWTIESPDLPVYLSNTIRTVEVLTAETAQ